MVDFFDEEHKSLDAVSTRLRQLLADIGSGDAHLKSVVPQLVVTSTGTEAAPEVTAMLTSFVVKGTTSLEALIALEAAVRISAFGTQAELSEDVEFQTTIDVQLVAPETSEDQFGLDGDADIGGLEH